VVKTSLFPAIACAAISLALTGCGDLERINNSDPKGPTGGSTLREQLVGRWSRDDGQQNEIYFFRADRRVDLRQFFSPDGGEVDRNARFPQTLEHLFSGTYILDADVLTISFTQAVSSSNEDIDLPPTFKVEIGIRGRTLTLNSKRLYTRLD